ncbi:metalloregulator ArsR/SmtB family transcription factor [Enterococcus cecorum]|uniref:ArsR/SmtB family transcription factor n=1 Tax=Enterococcus cecorum TaxID=44008 RepID=UPI002ACA5E29|nr:metalloregulator ArsR/SmtB family transcription factor [Enterococcus cecorum]MDZ5555231.1 metalloregulator ArsR/SmtB family transcription factor [Enterococcus cecorum]MDZ5590212.1 metalloregulator ArsR/SmtB family transcription factor [Enterococcus cecorum]MDZ5611060.1 metalloregulator ArsR/SmtB family transcription factor [Enterococcus cecorum]
MDKQTELHRIQQEFTDLADLLAAIGDETRQYLIQAMFELPCKQEGGARVGTITEKTHLSRPAVSHHIKILKDAGVVEMRKEGTKNYYYLETDNRRWQELAQLSQQLATLFELLVNHQLSVQIDCQYDFKDIQAALNYVAKGHAKGKVIVIIDDE